MAKALFQQLPDGLVWRLGAQTGLDIRVVLADNDDFWVSDNIGA